MSKIRQNVPWWKVPRVPRRPMEKSQPPRMELRKHSNWSRSYNWTHVVSTFLNIICLNVWSCKTVLYSFQYKLYLKWCKFNFLYIEDVKKLLLFFFIVNGSYFFLKFYQCPFHGANFHYDWNAKLQKKICLIWR